MFKSIRDTGGRSLRHQSKMKSVGKCSIYYKVWVNSKLSIGWVLRATARKDAHVVYSDSHQHNPAIRVETLGHLDKKFLRGGHGYCRSTYEESRKTRSLFGVKLKFALPLSLFPTQIQIKLSKSPISLQKVPSLLSSLKQFHGGKGRKHLPLSC